MPLYPTLEDLRVTEYAVNEANKCNKKDNQLMIEPDIASFRANYNEQLEYMGLSLMGYVFTSNGDIVTKEEFERGLSLDNMVVAPVSQKPLLTIQQGVRKVLITKDFNGMLGLRVTSVDTGIFVYHIQSESPAAKAGVHFGDQIINIDGKEVTGLKSDRVASLITNSQSSVVELILRDRPFERTITINKDSKGSLGFTVDNGMIVTITANSSASRNGLLTSWYIVEVDGKNIVGLSNNDLIEIFKKHENSVTLTVMPKMFYNVMVKRLDRKTLAQMDRSL